MNTLIIGGTSGLGLALAEKLSKDYQVFVTGRRDPQVEDVNFIHLDLTKDEGLSEALDRTIEQLLPIKLLVYAAGFYQEGKIDDLSDMEIAEMDNVGLRAPAMLLSRLLKKQDELPGFIAITSTSQFTARLYEPVYTAVKAGLAMLAKSVSLDERVGKVLVVAPAGMKTKFWKGTDKDTSTMLDQEWVAGQALRFYQDNFDYKEVRILREPPRTEVVEER